MTDYNALAKTATKRLQKSIGTHDDGYWGTTSQLVLNSKKAKVSIDWDAFRDHFGSFSQSQMDGINSILEAINNFVPTKKSRFAKTANKPAFVAYMLATAWHETGLFLTTVRNGRKIKYFENTMQPVSEMGKGAGRPYGKRIDVNGSVYSSSLPIYYGRGYVQLTWLTNYVLMRMRLGIDFVNHPELALVPENAADIMIVGMLEGSFTSRSMADYINYGLYFEFVEARRVINGIDKRYDIAQYAVKFLDSLVLEVA